MISACTARTHDPGGSVMPTPLHPSTTQAPAPGHKLTSAPEPTGDPGYHDTLSHIVELAVAMVPGSSAATISVPTRHTPSTAAFTDPGGRVADQMQFDLGEGPTLDAMSQTAPSHSLEVANDSRWPHWGPRAGRELVITSVLSFPLHTSSTTLGVLTLYSSSPSTITPETISHLDAFAAIAATAMHAARTAEQLTCANRSRLTIGQAQGILMKQFDLDADRAFAVMNRISQDTNTKLATVAERVITTRSLP